MNQPLIKAMPEVNNKIVYVFCGLPGSGKSTIAKQLAPSYNIASDDFPGLYANGYQAHLQKDSHAWCFSTFKEWCDRGVSPIAVHNTNMLKKYRDQFREYAIAVGYVVSVINVLGTYVEGKLAESIHSVPQNVIETMSRTFEPEISFAPLGLSISEAMAELIQLKNPSHILFDMDQAIKETNSGEIFPKNPEDWKLTPHFSINIKRLIAIASMGCRFSIVSNQQGVKFGLKTIEFLQKENQQLRQELDRLGLKFELSIFATGDRSIHVFDPSINRMLAEKTFKTEVKKPNTSIFGWLIEQEKLDVTKQIWVVGDAHTDQRSEDWMFAKNCRDEYGLDIRYIPIEMLTVALRIAAANRL